jgi:ribosome biogenesis protein
VPDAPYVLPIKLGRVGLSEVINHLLGRDGSDEALQAIAFDFLIQGHMLRSSLQKYLAANPHISIENILLVEYMPALRIGEDTQSQDMRTWIGSILVASNATSSPVVITATYDGKLQHHDAENLAVNSYKQCHEMPIRAIASLTTSSSAHHADLQLATASKDQTIKLWRMSTTSSSTSSFIQTHCLRAHANSVESLCGWTTSSRQMLLSGDWSGNILGWNLAISSPQLDVDEKKAKKRKGGQGSIAVDSEIVEVKSPPITIRAHSQAVTDIAAHVESGMPT